MAKKVAKSSKKTGKKEMRVDPMASCGKKKDKKR